MWTVSDVQIYGPQYSLHSRVRRFRRRTLCRRTFRLGDLSFRDISSPKRIVAGFFVVTFPLGWNYVKAINKARTGGKGTGGDSTAQASRRASRGAEPQAGVTGGAAGTIRCYWNQYLALWFILLRGTDVSVASRLNGDEKSHYVFFLLDDHLPPYDKSLVRNIGYKLSWRLSFHGSCDSVSLSEIRSRPSNFWIRSVLWKCCCQISLPTMCSFERCSIFLFFLLVSLMRILVNAGFPAKGNTANNVTHPVKEINFSSFLTVEHSKCVLCC